MRPIRLALLLAAAGLLAGCATLQSDRIREDPGDLPPRAVVSGVPFYAQEAHYCGPASLAMVLSRAGAAVSQDDVAPQVFTPGKEGSFRTDLLAAARRRGYLALTVRGMRDLLAELASDHPVLVFQNLGLSWYPEWHFAVAIGYDLPAGDIMLHTGTREARLLSLDTFEYTWARTGYWGMLVLPPDELPPTADASAVLEAAVGLEQAGRNRAAAQSYAAATRRWPRRLGGWVGLANARYRLGDLNGAEEALRAALDRHPRAAEAWNNLAVVLADRGEKGAAVAAAEKAVELGDAPAYRRTLREVGGGPASGASAGEGGG
ncbi:MAG TPA: PA2778 family cysteine peptidase [Gammaproteobacteria bacterium]|nr:PA2778 family cysteine peptidase [Gammaproteobacteria bacterium]